MHLFYCLGANNSLALPSDNGGGSLLWAPPPPWGWTAHSVCLPYSDTGGSTSGHWSFVVWYPPGLPWVEPLTWEPRGGTSLLCCVNNRKYATPFLRQRRKGAAREGVVRAEGLVLDFGLSPASDPLAWVIVDLLSSPLGYGFHCLTARELGDLWDIPILLLDSLLETDVGLLMAAICTSPPSKLLHMGADLLLTAVFWGGGVGRAREFLVPQGQHPLSDLELGLLSSMNKR
jgi:hypothetical protein